MSETVGPSDMGIGLAMAFGVLAILASAGMAIAGDAQIIAAWAFAGAMIAGVLAVSSLHIYSATR